MELEGVQGRDLLAQDRADTVADGIGARVPFALPVEVMRDGLDAMYTVAESTIEETVARTFEAERIPIEAASAPPIGLLDRLGDDLAGSTVVVPITGRNITGSELREIGRTIEEL